jgi:hypothetical protein
VSSAGVDDEIDTRALGIDSVTEAVKKALGKRKIKVKKSMRPVPTRSPAVFIPKHARPSLAFIQQM